jgi:hypothetical protein
MAVVLPYIKNPSWNDGAGGVRISVRRLVRSGRSGHVFTTTSIGA